jgi:ribosomal protein S18 acetylase RimI-like enzyme
MIRTIEELSMNAWPALESVQSDGWVLRFSQGYTRRANSVHPLERGIRDLADKIDEAEELYRAHNLAPTFKMTEASRPEELEVALADRGYRGEAGTSVRVATIDAGESSGLRVETNWGQTEAWRDAFHRMNHVAPERRSLHDRMLSRISSPVGYASLDRDGGIAACALGVVQGNWLGVFDVVVDEENRREGLGGRLMRGLMAWGRERGAERAYLQVMVSNAPALALYDKLGFREAYRYWYRVKS